eukprot:TRINITY_DN18701_c0_g1_i1.p1 TRINITY_DN18701_c0_g1~~TRINITY_DN18701_c0_g1_i1.p1  ORF type:complete len:103 (-),score=5.19 TRINITY_DN18701_c0_g1_i1:36-344(-)
MSICVTLFLSEIKQIKKLRYELPKTTITINYFSNFEHVGWIISLFPKTTFTINIFSKTQQWGKVNGGKQKVYTLWLKMITTDSPEYLNLLPEKNKNFRKIGV